MIDASESGKGPIDRWGRCTSAFVDGYRSLLGDVCNETIDVKVNKCLHVGITGEGS